MDITLNTAYSGMQVAMTRNDVTANNIANVNTEGFEQSAAQQTDVVPSGVRISNIAKSPNPSAQFSGTDITEQVKNLKEDKAGFTANAKVFKMQDKLVGEVIDLIA